MSRNCSVIPEHHRGAGMQPKIREELARVLVSRRVPDTLVEERIDQLLRIAALPEVEAAVKQSSPRQQWAQLCAAAGQKMRLVTTEEIKARKKAKLSEGSVGPSDQPVERYRPPDACKIMPPATVVLKLSMHRSFFSNEQWSQIAAHHVRSAILRLPTIKSAHERLMDFWGFCTTALGTTFKIRVAEEHAQQLLRESGKRGRVC